jgi:4-hydroxy-tetrahydrodipicolinate synthase
MMTTPNDLHGVIVPVVTTFDESGAIDHGTFVEQIDWMLAQDVDGLVVGGSTGEGYALDPDELLLLTRSAVKASAGRIPVLASIIADSTRSAVSRATMLRNLPLAALQIAPPHYIFSPSEDGLVRFYRAVAEAAGIPLIIYNVIPWAKVTPRLALRIMQEVPQVIAVKQSDRDMDVFAELTRSIGPERVFGALDGSLKSCYDFRIAGSIAAIASAVPKENVRLWRAVRDGRTAEAFALQVGLSDFWAVLTGPNLPARVKAAQRLQGLKASWPRAPMEAASPADVDALSRALHGLQEICCQLP